MAAARRTEWGFVLLGLFLIAGCSRQGVEQTSSTRSEDAPVATAASKRYEGPTSPSPVSEAPQAESPVVAAVSVLKSEAYVWTVLPGPSTCIDISSMDRVCARGEELRPDAGNQFLSVVVDFKNLGPQTFDVPESYLEAVHAGETVRYEAVDTVESSRDVVQPYGNAKLRANFEVPIALLDSAAFSLRSGGIVVPLTFETPEEAIARKASSRASAASQAEIERVARAEIEADYNKCWALNDEGAPQVSENEFDWYVENCSHLFDVGDYRTYRLSRSQRH